MNNICFILIYLENTIQDISDYNVTDRDTQCSPKPLYPGLCKFHKWIYALDCTE